MAYGNTNINIGGKKFNGLMGNGYSLAPIRDVGTALGAKVDWKDNMPWLNGQAVKDFQLINGQSYMKSRDLGGMMGADVGWDPKAGVNFSQTPQNAVDTRMNSLQQYTPGTYTPPNFQTYIDTAMKNLQPMISQGNKQISSAMESNMADRNVHPGSGIVIKDELERQGQLMSNAQNQAIGMAQNQGQQDYDKWYKGEALKSQGIDSANNAVMAQIQNIMAQQEAAAKSSSNQTQAILEMAKLTGQLPDGSQTLTGQKTAAEIAKLGSDSTANMIRANKVGSGGGGGKTPKLTQTERTNQNAGDAYSLSIKNYNKYRKEGYKYPLYYSIKDILTDDKLMQESASNGIDPIKLINKLIASKAKNKGKSLSVEEYFATKQGQDLAGAYYALVGKQPSQNGSGNWGGLFDQKSKNDPGLMQKVLNAFKIGQ